MSDTPSRCPSWCTVDHAEPIIPGKPYTLQVCSGPEILIDGGGYAFSASPTKFPTDRGAVVHLFSFYDAEGIYLDMERRDQAAVLAMILDRIAAAGDPAAVLRHFAEGLRGAGKAARGGE